MVAAINCAVDIFSTGATDSNGGCVCVANFVWNPTSIQCEYNCSSVTNSNGIIVSGSQDICRCVLAPAYAWAAATKTCNLNCSALANSDNNTQVNNTCQCIPKFKFVSTTNLIGCVLNCSAILNSLNTTTPNGTACNCATGYVWNGTTISCNLNCAALPRVLTPPSTS